MAEACRDQLIAHADQLWLRIEQLLGGDFDAAAVHEMRVACKRLRACWLLRRRCDDPERVDREERRLRAIAKQLGGQRDLDVAHDTCRKLLADSEGASAEALRRLRKLLQERSTRRMALGGLDLGEELRQANAAWRAGLDQLDDESLKRGLRRIYRRGRRWWLRAAAAEQDDAIQHRWRRWVKYLAQAAEALDQLAGRRGDLKKLGTLLGKRHDLAVLRHLLPTELEDEELELILAAIDTDDQVLRERCRELGQACFSARRRAISTALGL